MRGWAILSLFLALANPSLSQADSESALRAMGDDPYFTITSIEVFEVKDEYDLSQYEIGTGQTVKPTDEIVVIDRIINLGKKIWKIVEENKPVVDVREDVASALPQGVQSWNELESWNMPQSKVYGVIYRNGFNKNIVKFYFRVIYTAGGTYESKGKYLSRVTVVPALLEVAWGYNVAVEGGVPAVANAGTKENPLAQAEILVRWNVKTVVKEARTTASFFVRGDGTFSRLSYRTVL